MTELPTMRLWTGVTGTRRTVGKLAPLPQNTAKAGRGAGEAPPQEAVEDTARTPRPRIVEMNGEWPGQKDAGSIRVQILPPLPEGTEDHKNGIGPQGAPAERSTRRTRAPLMNQTMRDTYLKYPQSQKKWKLKGSQKKWVRDAFTKYYGEEELDHVLRNCPPPSHTFLKADELAKSVANGLAKKVGTTAATITLQRDAMHKKHQLKVIQPMGPLGKLWLKLEEARKSKRG